LTKKPDIKWKRESEDIIKLQNIQIEILDKAAQYVKPGGVLVYSTCTTEPEENTEVVEKFLEIHPEFSIDSAEQYVRKEVVNDKGFIEVFPHRHNIDGAFGARFVKNS